MEPFVSSQTALNKSALDEPNLLSGQMWGELRTFLAVAKAKSFNRAAEILGTSQPTVSRQVKRLQDMTGSQLFVSTTHGVMLTETGQRLAEAAAHLDEHIFMLSSGLKSKSREIEGIVRVALTDGLASVFVAPSLTDFSLLYPNVGVHLKRPINLVDLHENQTDIVIGFSPPTSEEMAFQPAGHLHLIPIASRDYIRINGLPTRDNISSHRVLQSDYYSAPTGLWDAWLELCARANVLHQSDHMFAYVMLVKSGHGVGLLASYTSIDKLAVPLDLGVHVSVPMYIVAVAERLRTRPVRVVFDWLATLLGSENPWFSKELKLDASSGLDAGYRSLFNLGDR